MKSHNIITIKKAKQELDWYYNHSSADLGICSNFSSIINQSFGFSGASNLNLTEDRMVALASRHDKPITKLRRIEHSIAKLTHNHRRLLNAVYDSYNFPPQLISVFGPLTPGVLFQNVLNLNDLIKLCSDKLSKRPYNHLLIEKLKIDAQKFIDEAHTYYCKYRNEKST